SAYTLHPPPAQFVLCLPLRSSNSSMLRVTKPVALSVTRCRGRESALGMPSTMRVRRLLDSPPAPAAAAVLVLWAWGLGMSGWGGGGVWGGRVCLGGGGGGCRRRRRRCWG